MAGFSRSAFQYDFTEANLLPKELLAASNIFFNDIRKRAVIICHGLILRYLFYSTPCFLASSRLRASEMALFTLN